MLNRFPATANFLFHTMILLSCLLIRTGVSANDDRDWQETTVCVDTAGLNDCGTCQYLPGNGPMIQRLSSTVALELSGQPASTAIVIEALIIDPASIISVRLFYRQTGVMGQYYKQLDMQAIGDNIYRGIIPACDVTFPGVDYYIYALNENYFHSTDPREFAGGMPFQIAVLPNEPPVITYSPLSGYPVGMDIDVSATVTDTTDYVSVVVLNYKKSSDFFYRSQNMTDSGNGLFTGVIPAEYATSEGLDYFIIGEDNYILDRYTARPYSPHHVNPYSTGSAQAIPIASSKNGQDCTAAKDRFDSPRATPAVLHVDCLGVDASLYPQIDMYSFISDENFDPILDLDKSAFSVFDQGDQQRIDVQELTAGGNVAVALVIDTSASMSGIPLQNAKIAAHEFVNSISDTDRLAIVSFGNEAQLVQSFTGNKDALNTAIDSLTTYGNTALFDGICIALDEAVREIGVKAVVVLTDGCENASQEFCTDIYSVCDKATHYLIPVFTIGISDSKDQVISGDVTASESRDFYCPDELTAIADCSHGSFYEGSSADISDIYSQISVLIQSVYMIRYIVFHPTPTPTCTGSPVPTNTPTPPPTATGSATPRPTSTGTQPPTSTPTPSCRETGVTLDLPQSYFHAGDQFYLMANVCNITGNLLVNHPLFVILDVYGSYWFAPSWSQSIDYYSQGFNPGLTQISVINPFRWPSNVGSGTGIVFWGAMTDEAMTEIFGTYASVEFGWGP